MSLTDISAVRLKAADRSAITREQAVGEGESYAFKLGHEAILSTPDIEVRLDEVTQVTGFTVDYENGIVTFDSPPAMGVQVEFTYYWSIYTDDQIQYFLDDSGGNITVAAAKVLLAIAADAAKIAQRQSMAGGGGLGAVTIDTSVAARELRNSAKALIDLETTIGEAVPAEGITEINWTEMNYKLGIEQRTIRGG